MKRECECCRQEQRDVRTGEVGDAIGNTHFLCVGCRRALLAVAAGKGPDDLLTELALSRGVLDARSRGRPAR